MKKIKKLFRIQKYDSYECSHPQMINGWLNPEPPFLAEEKCMQIILDI